MRNRINKVLNESGIRDYIYIGYGARRSCSEIHLDLNEKKIDGMHYAIQFERETQNVAFWDIRERVRNVASLNLYVKKEMHWYDIEGITYFESCIVKRNSNIISKSIVMPYEQFAFFITNRDYFGFDKENTTSRKYDNDELETIVSTGNVAEGKKYEIYSTRYERNPKLRRQAIDIQGCCCKVCNFDFEKVYGYRGAGYIEIHHIKPLSYGTQMPDPSKDLICVCSNCHRMIHRAKDNLLTPAELRKIIASNSCNQTE